MNVPVPPSTLTDRIEAELDALDFAPQYIGFSYLLQALKWSVLNKQVPVRLSVDVYPRVASLYSVSPSAVEHGIRHLIRVTYQNNRNNAFWRDCRDRHRCPTNALVIAMLTRRVNAQRTPHEKE